MRSMTFRALVALLALGGASCRLLPGSAMGACTLDQGDPKTLVSACTAAINRGGLDDTDTATAYLGRARGYAMQKQYEPAIADLDLLIRRQPKNAIAHAIRGDVYGQKGDWNRALTDYESEARLAPDDAFAYAQIGNAYTEKGDYAAAETNFGKSIAMQPANPMALNGRCWSRAISGQRLDEALTDCDRALRYAPDDADTLNSRGFVQFRKQRYAEAIVDYDASIAREPSIGSSFYVRGLAKLATGNASGAADIAHGIELEPDVEERYAGYGVARPK